MIPTSTGAEMPAPSPIRNISPLLVSAVGVAVETEVIEEVEEVGEEACDDEGARRIVESVGLDDVEEDTFEARYSSLRGIMTNLELPGESQQSLESPQHHFSVVLGLSQGVSWATSPAPNLSSTVSDHVQVTKSSRNAPRCCKHSHTHSSLCWHNRLCSSVAMVLFLRLEYCSTLDSGIARWKDIHQQMGHS